MGLSGAVTHCGVVRGVARAVKSLHGAEDGGEAATEVTGGVKGHGFLPLACAAVQID